LFLRSCVNCCGWRGFVLKLDEACDMLKGLSGGPSTVNGQLKEKMAAGRGILGIFSVY